MRRAFVVVAALLAFPPSVFADFPTKQSISGVQVGAVAKSGTGILNFSTGFTSSGPINGVLSLSIATGGAGVAADSPLAGSGTSASHLTCSSCNTSSTGAIGDLAYFAATGVAVSRLPDVALGSVLISGGVGSNFGWSNTTVNGTSSATVPLTPANVSEMVLSTTGATTVATVTPASQGNYLVGIYYRVYTGSTTLNLVVSWTDSTGAKTATLIGSSNNTVPVGGYGSLPLFVNATASAITVTATAGTANQINISASIVRL